MCGALPNVVALLLCAVTASYYSAPMTRFAVQHLEKYLVLASIRTSNCLPYHITLKMPRNKAVEVVVFDMPSLPQGFEFAVSNDSG